MDPCESHVEIHTCSDFVGEETITFDSLDVDFVTTISELRHDIGLGEEDVLRAPIYSHISLDRATGEDVQRVSTDAGFDLLLIAAGDGRIYTTSPSSASRTRSRVSSGTVA